MGFVEDALNRVAEMAAEFNIEEGSDEWDNFIEQGMLKKGFRKVASWAEPEPEGNDGKKVVGMFSGSGGQTRRVGNDGKRQPYGY